MKTYNKFNLQVKRLSSEINSPILSHLSTTIAGISTIKAYDKAEEFEKKMKSKFEINNRCSNFSSDGSNYLSAYSNFLKNLTLLITTSSLILDRDNISAAEGKIFLYLKINRL